MDRELLLELKSFLAERMTDNMTTEQLAEYVQDDLFTYYDKQGEHEFLEEDYQMPNGYECLCEICFDILNQEGKIKWKEGTL